MEGVWSPSVLDLSEQFLSEEGLANRRAAIFSHERISGYNRRAGEGHRGARRTLMTPATRGPNPLCKFCDDATSTTTMLPSTCGANTTRPLPGGDAWTARRSGLPSTLSEHFREKPLPRSLPRLTSSYLSHSPPTTPSSHMYPFRSAPYFHLPISTTLVQVQLSPIVLLPLLFQPYYILI
ncbi:unnamed protein product [Arctogadus glacialis]